MVGRPALTLAELGWSPFFQQQLTVEQAESQRPARVFARAAEELGVRKGLVPYWPGLLCALGVLATIPKADFAVTHLVSTGMF